jgi:hypothetical protein
VSNRISPKADTDQQRAKRVRVFLYERDIAPLGKEKVAPCDQEPTLLTADDSPWSNEIERPIEA